MRVVITGTGAVSPLGDADAMWTGLLAGHSGVRTIPGMTGAVTSGGVALADEEVAIEAALRASGRDPATTGFVWGTALDAYHHVRGALVHATAGDRFARLATRFAAPRRMIAVACATGTAAIGEAFHLVRAGRAEACVAGGSSAMLGPFYLIGFHALRAVAADVAGEDPGAACKPFDRSRRGFALSDGSGAVVVESLASAQRRGAVPLAELVGYGASQDAFDLNRPPPDGAGALAAMRGALADAGCGGDAIDAINAHGTGTHAGDLAEAAAIRALLGERWAGVPVSGVKGALGHTMAAAGALEVIVAIATCRTRLVPPTVNLVDPDETCELDHVIGRPRRLADAPITRVLSSSFGMGGQNAALLVQGFVP